jgi:hypothetical protein
MKIRKINLYMRREKEDYAGRGRKGENYNNW